MKLSVIVLTRSESEKLDDCLKSIKNIADEIVVLIDSEEKNTDSEKIAKKSKAKILRKTFLGDFSKKRNYALKNAKGEYVLYVDDDERLTKELINEIKSIVKEKSEYSAFAIPRKNVIFGKEFKHCGQWPDYVIRLFKKTDLKKWQGKVHEQPEFNGELKHIEGAFVHLKHDDLESMVDKTNNWSEIEAKLMFDAEHPPMNIPRFITAMWREFFLRMIKQKAFLDGPEGIIYGMYQVYSRFISYAKLWEMQIK
jgi:(heptosyl)LPS beta-1,4-glucosyltransferase